MSEYKIILGEIAVGIILASSVLYIVSVLRGKTKPHAFSWLIWTVLTAIGFAAQLHEGGGAGAWANGANSLVCGIIFILALFKGNRQYTKFDWLVLSSAGIALVLWGLTGKTIVAVILITLADSAGYLPTIRKSLLQPRQEMLTVYVTSSIHQFLSILALQVYVPSTWLYPTTMVVMNILVVIIVGWRRFQTKRSFA